MNSTAGTSLIFSPPRSIFLSQLSTTAAEFISAPVQAKKSSSYRKLLTISKDNLCSLLFILPSSHTMDTPLSFLVGTMILFLGLLAFLFKPMLIAFIEILERNTSRTDAEFDPLVPISLVVAINNKNEKVIRAILTNSATVATALKEVDGSGNGPLHVIAQQGHYKWPPSDIPTLLIDAGIDINSKNKSGQTALEISLLKGWQKIAMLLLERNADRSCITSAVKARVTCPDCTRVIRQYNL